MKKTLSLVLALLMLFALSVPAFADDVTINASVSETYSMTIPASTTTLTWGTTTAQAFGTVGLSAAKLTPGHQVTITLSGNNGLVHSADSTKTIPYAVKNGSDDFTTANFTDTTHNIALTILVAEAAWNAAPAGSYSDTVTFTATVTDIITP